MSRSKLLCLLSVVVALLANFALNARADTIIDFETPTYATGGLAGQDGWFIAYLTWDGDVINTDASEGVQSLDSTGSLAVARTLDDDYAVGITSYTRVDVKGSSINMMAQTTAGGRLVEFGFNDTYGGFYLYSSASGFEKPETKPDTERWVTMWVKMYESSTTPGDMRVDAGWCELSETPFVDGLMVEDYDADDGTYGRINLGGDSGYVDNINIAVPEPGIVAMLLGGMIGLLCYAWRKRK